MSRLSELAEAHETWAEYYAEAWESATDKGSSSAAESALDLAAKHAAIATCLRNLSTGGKK